jgi:adenylosuccinate synthase
MKVDLLLGLQWGDEGKGKIVDVLTKNYDIIARFQGGPNAGHTLEFDGIKHVLHTIPSGIFHEKSINLIGNGVVIDPVIFEKEIEKLEPFNINFKKSCVFLEKHILFYQPIGFWMLLQNFQKENLKLDQLLKALDLLTWTKQEEMV